MQDPYQIIGFSSLVYLSDRTEFKKLGDIQNTEEIPALQD
jgi:hypothetical protein